MSSFKHTKSLPETAEKIAFRQEQERKKMQGYCDQFNLLCGVQVLVIAYDADKWPVIICSGCKECVYYPDCRLTHDAYQFTPAHPNGEAKIHTHFRCRAHNNCMEHYLPLHGIPRESYLYPTVIQEGDSVPSPPAKSRKRQASNSDTETNSSAQESPVSFPGPLPQFERFLIAY